MTATGSARTYRMAARADAVAASGERILASAWEHFARQPYDEVRLANIAAEARVTVQTLHNRFGPKDDLFVAAFVWFGSQQHRMRRNVPAGDATGAVRALYDGYEGDGTAVVRLMAEEERFPPIKKMLDAGRAYHREWITRVFGPSLSHLPRAARERRLVELTVATDLLVWKLLRVDMNLDRRAAERTVIEMVTALVAAPKGGS
jgi:AcrR family transcriptional regulator